MHRHLAAGVLVAAWAGFSAPARAQTLSPPQIVGRLVGPGSSPEPTGVRVYGNDLGWTFEHKGQLLMLFGDTSATDHSVCEPEPLNDDSLATLPLASPAGVPPILFATRAGDPTTFAPIMIHRGGESLPLGYGQVPLAGFSDGSDAYAVFGRFEYVRCTGRGPRKSCRAHPGLTCTSDVGECASGALRVPQLCNVATGAGCLPGSTCQPSTTGFCVDPTSSQNDGTPGSRLFMVAHDQEIGVQRPDSPTEFDSAGAFASNKFINLAARTVRCFSGRTQGSDYGAGHGAVLMWGRPAFAAEKGRQAQLYLLANRLPIRRDARGRMRFHPRYFAGLQPSTGEPLWTGRQADAAPLALDGIAGGSPHEDQPVLMHMTFAWLGPPVNKWMAMNGGDLASYLLEDPAHAQPGPVPGAIRVRFADHPWGPWTPAIPHLAPGDPGVVGDLYGPDGWMFHPQCVDRPPALCARSDEHRPLDSFFAGCPQVGKTIDAGKLYAPDIIDPYTGPDGHGGIEITWNVSGWNPYGVLLLKSTITPGVAPTAASVPASAAPGRGRPTRLRWCAG